MRGKSTRPAGLSDSARPERNLLGTREIKDFGRLTLAKFFAHAYKLGKGKLPDRLSAHEYVGYFVDVLGTDLPSQIRGGQVILFPRHLATKQIS